MFSKYTASLQKIKLSDLFLLLIIIALFSILNVLSSISFSLKNISSATDTMTTNTYGSLIYQANNNNKNIDMNRYEIIKQELNLLEELIK